jgi:Protein of unknown function (DUF2793)
LLLAVFFYITAEDIREMTTTTNLALPLIAAGQAQKHVTHNEALLATPPGVPAEGDRYIVAASPTGAWAGKAGQVAAWQDGIWRFHAPKAGWIAFVVDELQLYHFTGAAWAPGVSAITNLQNLSSLGIGTTADAANPFSTKLNGVLHAARTAAEGGSGNIQVKLSKESAAKTASYLFQTNFSGRAELGLAGDDDFRLKVSADGSAWTDALLVDRATGSVSLPAGARPLPRRQERTTRSSRPRPSSRRARSGRSANAVSQGTAPTSCSRPATAIGSSSTARSRRSPPPAFRSRRQVSPRARPISSTPS